MLDKSHRYVGTIIQPESNKYYSFMLNNESNLQIDSIVAIEAIGVEDQANILLSKVRKIETSYYIKNPDLYFLNKAANNQLDKIDSQNTQYGIIAICDILGYYKFNEKAGYSASKDKFSLHTPVPLQKVFKVPEVYLNSIYGLSSKIENNVVLGQVVHPFKSEAIVQPNLFKIHTLISGISGSGKTRLASLIINNLAANGAHVIILDPHYEYLDLLLDKKKVSEQKINVYSRFKKSHKTSNILKQLNALDEYENIRKEKLVFNSHLLTATMLCKVLQNLTSHQEELIHTEFEYACKLYNEENPKEDLLEYFYAYLNQQLVFSEEEINQLIFQEKGKQVIHSYQINKFLELKRNDGKRLVVEAVARRVSELLEQELFVKELPSWLKDNSGTIDIINEDFSDDEFGKRMVNTIMSHFLESKTNDKQRILVIDEAHKLLNIEDNQTRKLIFQLLRESRKFNTSLLLLTQNYNDLPPEVLSLFHNVYRFKEVNNEEYQTLPSRMCHVNSVNSACNYIMQVSNVESYF
jgi:DNA helicase HerA-like ATPase